MMRGSALLSRLLYDGTDPEIIELLLDSGQPALGGCVLVSMSPHNERLLWWCIENDAPVYPCATPNQVRRSAKVGGVFLKRVCMVPHCAARHHSSIDGFCTGHALLAAKALVPALPTDIAGLVVDICSGRAWRDA